MHILVVEDELEMAELLKAGLKEEGHSVICAADGLEGLSLARHEEFDVVVLDLMLPLLDGLSVARRLRSDRNPVPILALTAKDEMAEIVEGLDSGADDYLTKPFALEELHARLRALARRGPTARPLVLEVADLSLNPATRRVTRKDRPLKLTRTEHRLLELLMRRSPRIVTRETIVEIIWGFDADVGNNTLDVLVSQLRRKVDLPGETPLLHTERGIGYFLRKPEEC